MIRQRVSSLFTTLSLVLSLFAASVAVPASTLAALPLVDVGHGTYPSLQPNGAQPGTVSPGGYVAFSEWAFNHDTSTISQFFLTANTTGTVYSVTWSKSGGTSQTCAVSVPLNCSFGQLKPGQWIDAFIVIKTSASGDSMTATFVWSTVGIGHGYTFPDADNVALNSSGDFAGGYLISGSSLTVGDGLVGPGNSQSTAAIVNNSGIPVTVQDGALFTPPDLQTCTVSSTFDCTGFFGDWSSVSVDNNHVFTSFFTITITVDATLIPKGVTKNNLNVYHQYFDIASSSWKQELISARCDTGAIPCVTVTTGKVSWIITIHTLHNGSFRNV